MSRHDDISQDQFSGVDFLMDENILTNESREEEDGRIVRTPNNNLKNQNSQQHSINQINSAGFTNQPGMKKVKGSLKTT